MDTDNKVQGKPWDSDVRGSKNNRYDLDPNTWFFCGISDSKTHPRQDLKFQNLSAEQESEGLFFLFASPDTEAS